MNFRSTATVAILASALAISSAHTAVTVRFDMDNVALGYTDGYYDNDHHWHRWRHRSDLARFRAAHADMYHEWRHNDRRHHDEH